MNAIDQTGAIRFDKQDQVDKIQAGLLPGETIIAVYDGRGGGTGFIGLTDRRVVLQDNSFVGKKVALTSVPYSKINAVSFVSDKSLLGKFASSSSIAVSAGGSMYEIEFRGEDKAKHAHDVILGFMTSPLSRR
jgi:Bacterial PH domain